MKRKEAFISDKRRVSYLTATYNRIYRGQSVLIEGDYGAGKTLFLKLLRPKKLYTVWVESLFNIHETLSSILKELNYDTTATYRRTPEYLKKICALSNCFIIIDEANDLDKRVWPYLKRIIDAGVPIVFAGLPKVRTFLTSEHPDILSRLKTLILYPIVVEDFIAEYNDIEQEAVEQIYMATRGDMRKFKEICTDCMDRAKELKYSFVDLNLALEFISDLPPQ
jgi:thymidine kinase